MIKGKLKKFIKECSYHIPEQIIYFIYRVFRLKEYKNLRETILLMENNNYILEHEEKLLNNILDYAYTNSVFYNNLFDEFDLMCDCAKHRSLEKIPVINKNIMRQNMTKIKVKNFMNMKKLKINTGGTTGDPFEFFRSLEQGVIDRICLELLYEQMGYKKGDRIITFNGANIDKKRIDNNIFWDRKGSNIPYGSIYFSSIYLQEDNIENYVQQLFELEPDIIRGYPSFVYEVGKYILDKNIIVPYKVKGIQLTSEVTASYQLEVIKKAFSTNIYFQYGHSEACIFAFAGEDMKYFCNPYYGYVEIVDENGKHVEVGECGRVIVTSYHNYVMPFIRYDTGDIAEYGGRENGYIVLNKLYGRTQDYIYNKRGEKYSLTGVVFGQHLKAFKNIKKWQLEQNDFNEIQLNIIKDDLYSESDENELREHFNLKCKLDTNFNYINKIELTSSGKFKFLKQNLKI